MVRTIITPDTQTVYFKIPKDYVGKELQVIAFANNEGLRDELGGTDALMANPRIISAPIEQDKNVQPASVKKTMMDFKGILSDETAEDLRKQAELSRKQWAERLNKQF